jgi:hypothetical protein
MVSSTAVRDRGLGSGRMKGGAGIGVAGSSPARRSSQALETSSAHNARASSYMCGTGIRLLLRWLACCWSSDLLNELLAMQWWCVCLPSTGRLLTSRLRFVPSVVIVFCHVILFCPSKKSCLLSFYPWFGLDGYCLATPAMSRCEDERPRWLLSLCRWQSHLSHHVHRQTFLPATR